MARDIKKTKPTKPYARNKTVRKKANFYRRLRKFLAVNLLKISHKLKLYRARRPHRSFRHTPRKIAQRPLQIEGYFRFSRMVLRQIWQERKFFSRVFLVGLIASWLVSGFMSSSTFNNLRDTLNNTYRGGNNLGDSVFKAGLLLVTTATSGGFNPVDTEGKQLVSAFLLLVIWLVIIWYLRQRLAGHQLKFRDALYRACAPIISILMITFYLIIQMIPMMIFIIFYSSARSTNFAQTGVEGFILHTAMVLMLALTIYWLEGSLMAMIVATLPNIYPGQAIKIAGDLVIGRRFKILLRLLWHALQMIGFWIVVGLPIIALDNWLSGQFDFVKKYLPITPVAVAVLTLLSVIWTYTYFYFLYRRVIEDESKPA